MRRRWTTADSDGVRLAVEHASWGAAPARVRCVMSHATGFCKEVMRPTTTALADVVDGAEVVSYDHRNHGASDKAPHLDDWWPLAADALAVVDKTSSVAGGAPVIGIGHSCGGAALAYAELVRPGTFQALVLIEPIVFPSGEPGPSELVLVRRALRRKAGFPSRAEAIANFSEKPTFSAWRHEALDEYVWSGFEPDGDTWALRCAPEDEANFYASARARSGWDRLGEIECPIVVVAGAASDTHTPQFIDALAGRFTGATVDVVTVPDVGHFVPMERPEAIADIVATCV